MKSLLKASLLALGLSISAFAADSVPVNSKGDQTQPMFAGANTCVINVSTGTNAVLCTAGSGIILQVIPSSITTDVLVLRDSATANVTSSTLAVVVSGNVPGIYTYPRFNNGLSANTLNTPANTVTWTIIYAKNLK